MSIFHRFLAVDLGAESGRAELVTLDENRIELKEIHRFQNRPVKLNGTLFWDFPFLFAEILYALKMCTDRAIRLDGIGIDTWGVDFGLLDPDNHLLSNPVHYRDTRTEDIHKYSDPIMSREEIFSLTACEPWTISSLFQLLAIQRDNPSLLNIAGSFLHMPDLFNFFLTGIKVSERSIVSTSNLLATNGQWCSDVIRKFGLPDIFQKLVEPGTVLGPISPEIKAQTNLGDVPVIATCGHDTAAVAAAIPASGENWAFLSSGTWSILGMLRREPVTSKNFFEKGFSNEYSLDGWFLCRNIIGLWLIQELCRKWDTPADAWNYDRMTREAAEVKSGPMLDVADESLLSPPDMENALRDLFLIHSQPAIDSRGELVRCVLESLALEYAFRMDMMRGISGSSIESLFMVGGGTANTLLCQLTASACDLTVFAGVPQCTSLGNALVQANALDIVNGPDQIREIMRNSFDLIFYEPQDSCMWKEKLDIYRELKCNRRPSS